MRKEATDNFNQRVWEMFFGRQSKDIHQKENKKNT